MIKEESYHKTVGILFDAYFNGTLMHGKCSACAVGNICAGYGVPELKGDRFAENGFYNNASWAILFRTSGFGYKQDKYPYPEYTDYKDVALRVVNQTGYTHAELAKIEWAFESAPGLYGTEDHLFNGLCAVLEVLKDIHQVTDEDLIQGNNKRFKDHYQKRLTTV